MEQAPWERLPPGHLHTPDFMIFLGAAKTIALPSPFLISLFPPCPHAWHTFLSPRSKAPGEPTSTREQPPRSLHLPALCLQMLEVPDSQRARWSRGGPGLISGLAGSQCPPRKMFKWQHCQEETMYLSHCINNPSIPPAALHSPAPAAAAGPAWRLWLAVLEAPLRSAGAIFARQKGWQSRKNAQTLGCFTP